MKRYHNRYPRTRRAAYQSGELAESIELLRPQDLLTEEGRPRMYGDFVTDYSSGPGRPFGRVDEVLKLADDATREEMREAEEAMEHLNKRLDAYMFAVDDYGPRDDGYGETWTRFGLMETDNGIFIVVDVGGFDI